MHETIKKMAQTFAKQREQRRRACAAFTALAILVSLSTTYLLVQPANTMAADYICGMEAHVHTDACYELICGYGEEEETDSAPMWSEPGEETGEDEVEASPTEEVPAEESVQEQEEPAAEEVTEEPVEEGPAVEEPSVEEEQDVETEPAAESEPVEVEQTEEPATREEPVVQEVPEAQESPAASEPAAEAASESDAFAGTMNASLVVYSNGSEEGAVAETPAEPSVPAEDTSSGSADVSEPVSTPAGEPAEVTTPAEEPAETEETVEVEEAPVVEEPAETESPVEENTSAEEPVEEEPAAEEPSEEVSVEETVPAEEEQEPVGEEPAVEQEAASGSHSGGHVHTDACYQLICGKEEHEHSEACMSLMTLLSDLGELPEGYTNEYSVFGDGYTVAVFAPDGALPEGAELVATLLEEGDDAHTTARQTLEAMVAQEMEINVAGVMSEAALQEAAAASENTVPVESEELIEKETQVPVGSDEGTVIEENQEEIAEPVDEIVEEETPAEPEVEEESVVQEELVEEEVPAEGEVLVASLVHNDNAPVEEIQEEVAEITEVVEATEEDAEDVLDIEVIEEVTEITEVVEATEEVVGGDVLDVEVTEEVTENLEATVTEEQPIPYEEEFRYDGFVAMDIHFELDGEEIEPARPVFVYINVNGLLPETADPDSVKILHIKEEKTEEESTLLEKLIPTLTPAPVVESVEVVADETENTGLVEAEVENVTTFFAVDSFSIFPIVWSGTSYVGTKLSSELSGSSYDARYDIKTLPVTLIDYDPGSMTAWMDVNRSANAVHGMEFHGFERWSGYGAYPTNTSTNKTMTSSEYYALTNKGVNGGGRIIKQGILSATLDTDGLPNMIYGNHAVVGRAPIIDLLFDDNDLAHNWTGWSAHDPSKVTKAKTVYKNVDMEFVYDNETGYYTYNSVANHAQFNGTDAIELYMDTLSPRIAISGEDKAGIEENKAGFYPFNDIAKSYENTDSGGKVKMDKTLETWAANLDSQEYTYANRAASLKSSSLAAEAAGDLNNHFGMKLEFDFYLPKDGKLDDGTPLKFEFNGDDDLWVYIDGKLVLDMGGAHSRSGGYIDFSNGGTVFVENAVNIADVRNQDSDEMQSSVSDVTKTFQQLGLTGDNALAEKKIHHVTIFYMERFGSVSNCFMKFNMPVVPDGNLIVTKEVTGLLSSLTTQMDYTFQLTEADGDAIPNEPYAVYSSDGSGSAIANTRYTGENGYFTLKADQMAIFTSMAGLSDVYVEELLLDGSDAKKYTDASKTTFSVNNAEPEGGMKTGLIGIVPGEQQSVVFKNSLADGNLTINKFINRTDGVEQEPTNFTFQLKAAPLAGESYNNGAVVFNSNGVANVTVTSGTPFTIAALPAGQIIEISETNYDGYAPSFSMNNTDWTSGAATTVTVEAETAVNVYFRNTTGAELPSTGGMGTHIYTILGTVLMLSAGVLLLDQRRRREGPSAA